MTPAEQLDWALQAGANRFLDSFFYVMKDQSQGGRTPGLTLASKETAKQFFEHTNRGYWQTLAQADPREAQSQVQQFKAVS